MLKFAADLSHDYEYGVVWGGQSNARPWGAKSEGYAESPELELQANGIDLTGVVLDASNRIGLGVRVTVGNNPALVTNRWQGAQLRIFRASGGTGPGLFNHYTDPLGGYATVVTNIGNELLVDWIRPAVTETGADFTGTCKGYLTFADDKFKSYPNVRILTPYQPEANTGEVTSRTTNYPDPVGTKLGAPGYSLPVGITSFEDLGLFLPLSFLEGIDSYGLSNQADSANGLDGARGSLAASASIMVLTNTAIQAPVDALAGGYLYVEWIYDLTGIFSTRRSWARLLKNERTAGVLRDVLYIDTVTGWQGDGVPELWSNQVATDANSTTAAGAPHLTASSLTPFSGVVAGDLVVVTSAVGVSLGIVAVVNGGGSSIDLDGAGWMGGQPTSAANTVVVYHNATFGAVTHMEAWVPHYRNSPYANLGPGFRYPNNDMQPCAFATSANNATVAAGTAVTGTATSITAVTMVDSGASWEPNRFVGWIAARGTSWMRVLGNTRTVLNGAWIGGTPGVGTYTLTNELGTGARIHNRPCGITPYTYGDRFGAIISFASQLSASLGKRVNIIHLGINSSPIYQQKEANLFGYPGQIGWWDWQKHLTWSPSQPDGQADRLKRMIEFIGPKALLAEGSAKQLRILSIIWPQGEADALGPQSRTNYGRTVTAFFEWLRDLIEDAGLSPYANGAKIPVVQPRIRHIPYELTGQFTYYNQLSGLSITLNLTGDDQGWVNNFIVERAENDAFGDYVLVDDLPALGETSLINGIDPLHFDGKGEVGLGRRLALAAGQLIDFALSFGSPCLQHQPAKQLAICNMALAAIGESQITSLDDGSTQANLCKQFWFEATDTLLQARQWGFALRRVELAEVKAPPRDFLSLGPLYDQYAYCYAVPAEALNAFAVLPPSPDSDYLQVSHEPEGPQPNIIAGGPAPAPFAIETSPYTGARLLFTNQEDAVLRYVAKVYDADQFSPTFATALAWYLASMLASSIIKGDAGEAVSQRCLQKAGGFVRLAATSDGNQRGIKLQHIPDHLANR